MFVGSQGLVAMDKQKPRDNTMYHISDKTNLRSQDKALTSYTDKFGTFSHKVLSHSEIRKGKKRRFKADQSTDSAVSDIWRSFTVPIHLKVSRSKRGKSQPRTRPEQKQQSASVYGLE